MSALNLSESRITHRQQIVQLLKMAIDQQWQFSYIAVIRNHVDTHPVRLRAVNVQDGVFELDHEIERNGQNLDEPVMFRGQSGGISVVFKARVAGAGQTATPLQPGRFYRMELPYEVRLTQLRKSIRLNVENLGEPVSVVLYLAMGVQLDAELVDISSTGAQFKIKEDVREQFKSLQILEACKITVTDDLTLRTGAQLLELNYIMNTNATFLRCQFVDMSANDEAMLENYINEQLEQADSSTIVITS